MVVIESRQKSYLEMKNIPITFSLLRQLCCFRSMRNCKLRNNNKGLRPIIYNHDTYCTTFTYKRKGLSSSLQMTSNSSTCTDTIILVLVGDGVPSN